MAFKDLDSFFTGDALPLPIGGKTYTFRSPDAETGITVNRIFSIGARASQGQEVTAEELESLTFDDDDERDLMQRVMGDTYDELIDDGVSWLKVQHVQQLLMLWITGADQDTLERFWASGGAASAEGKAGNRETRRAAARTTRKPASTSGTRTPRKTASPGRKSSTSGS